MFTRSLSTLLLVFPVSVAIAASSSEEVDPQALADLWTQAYNTHNPSALADLYGDDAIMMLHGSLTLRGKQAIHDYWVDDFSEGNPITTLTVTNVIEGADMRLVHGNYQVIERNDGTLLGQGRYAHIWLLDEAGNWLLDRDLWNEPASAYPK